MTIPIERSQAVVQMGDAAISLLEYAQPKIEGEVYIAVPAEIVRAICGALRHYPNAFDLEQSARELPTIWGWHK